MSREYKKRFSAVYATLGTKKGGNSTLYFSQGLCNAVDIKSYYGMCTVRYIARNTIEIMQGTDFIIDSRAANNYYGMASTKILTFSDVEAMGQHVKVEVTPDKHMIVYLDKEV